MVLIFTGQYLIIAICDSTIKAIPQEASPYINKCLPIQTNIKYSAIY